MWRVGLEYTLRNPGDPGIKNEYKKAHPRA